MCLQKHKVYTEVLGRGWDAQPAAVVHAGSSSFDAATPPPPKTPPRVVGLGALRCALGTPPTNSRVALGVSPLSIIYPKMVHSRSEDEIDPQHNIGKNGTCAHLHL